MLFYEILSREGCFSMNNFYKALLAFTLSLVTVQNIFARWVTQDEVSLAATSTLSKPLFQKNFPNATIKSISNLDGLWCVELAPNGYLIFSGSTKQMPLLKYALDAFVSPAEDSADFKIQTNMRNRAKSLENSSTNQLENSVSVKSPAETSWETLLNPLPKFQCLTAADEELEEDEEPLPDAVDLTSDEWDPNWSQWSPWNDFCPQAFAEGDEASTDFFRNRVPVGCGVTMYSQVMKYYEWPLRIDAIYSKSLTANNCALQDENHTFQYEMRFHGGLPIEWNTLKDDYWKRTEEGWISCFSSEAERLPVARLCLLLDILSNMNFDIVDNGGSGSVFLNTCANDWYDFGDAGVKEGNEGFSDEQIYQIKSVLAEGCVIPSSLPEHFVLICGYQVDENDQTYLKINYGWANTKNDDGSDSNQYYLADEAQIDSWLLNHYPKVQVQVAPLPKTINVNDLPILTWMVPECHEDEFTGFTISATPYSSDKITDYVPSTSKLEDLTANTDIFSIVAFSNQEGNQMNALSIAAADLNDEIYYFPEAFIPTENSSFTCQIVDLRENEEIVGPLIDIQLWNEDDLSWETIATLPEQDETGELELPASVDVSLADYAEQFCRLRLVVSSNDEDEEEEEGEEEEKGEEEEALEICYGLIDIAVKNVYAQGTPVKWSKKANDRELQLSGLTSEFGSRYRIKVAPKTMEEPGQFGETFTRLTNDPVAMPMIKSVTNITGELLNDSIMLEGDLDGRSGFRVICNEAVTELRALSSCPTLISDENITVYRYDEHVFDVIIDSPQTVNGLDGSRMVITLEARTAQENVVYKDMVFSLRSNKESVVYIEPTVIEREVDGETLEVPDYWLRKYELANEEATEEELEIIADEDADKDGLLNWQEFLCGTSPIDASEKLHITNIVFNDDGSLKEINYTPKAIDMGVIHLEGKVALTDAIWEEADMKRHHFFRLRVTIKLDE
jgi:cation transport regulator ChaB